MRRAVKYATADRVVAPAGAAGAGMMTESGGRERAFDGAPIATAGVYDIDPVHTFVMFSVRHLVFGWVDGRVVVSAGQFTVLDDPERLFDIDLTAELR